VKIRTEDKVNENTMNIIVFAKRNLPDKESITISKLNE
jgi:hypothetical protein